MSDTPGKGKTKVAAGWLIEHAGWKGFRNGDAGVLKTSARIGPTMEKQRSRNTICLQKIQNSVFDKFGIALETEVNVI